MSLANHDPAFAYASEKVIPREIDRYEVYNVINPSIDPVWVGTVAGTQTTTGALVLINKYLDYPRSLSYGIAAASGSARGGSITANGYDQFGSAITETVAISPANGGGTVNGTAIFSEVTSGTTFMGTGNAGPGTGRLGVAIAANDYWFGLPVKVAGTADVKRITHTGSGGVTLTLTGTNSIGTLVSATTHAFRGTAALTGTMSLTATTVSTFANNEDVVMANLSQ